MIPRKAIELIGCWYKCCFNEKTRKYEPNYHWHYIFDAIDKDNVYLLGLEFSIIGRYIILGYKDYFFSEEILSVNHYVKIPKDYIKYITK